MARTKRKQKRNQVRSKPPKSSSMEDKAEEDRISILPQGVLLHILSFLSTRSAIQTSLVSRTWNNLWLSLDTLRLKSSDFAAGTLDRLESSASHVRHLQYHATRQLDARRCPDQKSPILARVLRFAAERSCPSLDLRHVAFVCLDISSFLPNVTTLRLDDVKFRVDPEVGKLNVFSNCPNLQDLSLINCFIDCSKTFEISCPKLKKLRVVDPFLFLAQYDLKCKLVVSSPELTSLEIVDIGPFPLSVESDSLCRVSFSVDVCYWIDVEINGLMEMLQELRGVKHLELSMLVLQGLSKYPDLLGKQKSGFHGLKSLKVRADTSCSKLEVTDLLMNFLLSDSPSAKVTLPE